jgi:hypothetical protein
VMTIAFRRVPPRPEAGAAGPWAPMLAPSAWVLPSVETMGRIGLAVF